MAGAVLGSMRIILHPGDVNATTLCREPSMERFFMKALRWKSILTLPPKKSQAHCEHSTVKCAEAKP